MAKVLNMSLDCECTQAYLNTYPSDSKDLDTWESYAFIHFRLFHF